MTLEKCNHQLIKWFPMCLIYTMLFSYMEVHLPLHKQLELELWHYSAKEKEPSWWRRQRRWGGRVIQTKVKHEWADGHALGKAQSDVVSESVTPLICVFSYLQDLRRFKTGILSTKPVYLGTQLAVSLCLSTALRSGFLDQTGILMIVFYLWTEAWLEANGSRVAYTTLSLQKHHQQ